MGLFGFGRKKPIAVVADASIAAALAELLENQLNEPGRGVRVEDLLSAAAAVTGQACIRAAGDYDPDDHNFVPGASVLSVRTNELLVGDTSSWEAAPAGCVFAIVRNF